MKEHENDHLINIWYGKSSQPLYFRHWRSNSQKAAELSPEQRRVVSQGFLFYSVAGVLQGNNSEAIVTMTNALALVKNPASKQTDLAYKKALRRSHKNAIRSGLVTRLNSTPDGRSSFDGVYCINVWSTSANRWVPASEYNGENGNYSGKVHAFGVGAYSENQINTYYLEQTFCKDGYIPYADEYIMKSAGFKKTMFCESKYRLIDGGLIINTGKKHPHHGTHIDASFHHNGNLYLSKAHLKASSEDFVSDDWMDMVIYASENQEPGPDNGPDKKIGPNSGSGKDQIAVPIGPNSGSGKDQIAVPSINNSNNRSINSSSRTTQDFKENGADIPGRIITFLMSHSKWVKKGNWNKDDETNLQTVIKSISTLTDPISFLMSISDEIRDQSMSKIALTVQEKIGDEKLRDAAKKELANNEELAISEGKFIIGNMKINIEGINRNKISEYGQILKQYRYLSDDVSLEDESNFGYMAAIVERYSDIYYLIDEVLPGAKSGLKSVRELNKVINERTKLWKRSTV